MKKGKKVLTLLLIISMFFVNVTNVSARTLTIDNVATQFANHRF